MGFTTLPPKDNKALVQDKFLQDAPDAPVTPKITKAPKKVKETTDTKFLAVEIDRKLLKWIKAYANDNDLTVKSLVNEIFIEYQKNHKK